MRFHNRFLAAVVLTLAAAPFALAQEPAAPPTACTVHVGRPFVQVIRSYGQPSRVRSVELVPVAGGKATQAVVYIYERPGDVILEFLIGAEGKVLQNTTRTKALDQFRIEPKP
jgi:hypothetical protein